MIYNLKDHPANSTIKRKSEICIVGGGTAGLYLAQSLSNSGINVIVVELGGETILDANSSFDDLNFSNQIYKGALKGRVSGLGGTSSKWGGQMISMSDADFNDHEGVSDNISWPITKQELMPYYRKVATTMGFDNSSFSFKNTKAFQIFEDSLLSKFFNIRISTWIPFRKRNLFYAFNRKYIKKKNIEIWKNAKLVSFENSKWKKNNLKRLTLCGPNDQSLEVTSDFFVLTSGAIETTKFVSQILALKSGSKQFKSPFCDHISSKIGYLRVRNRKVFLSTFSPFFVKNILKTIRFEFRYDSQVASQTASAFVHFATQQKEGSALDIIRIIFRRLQGEPFKVKLLDINLKSFFKDLILIFFWRVRWGKLILNHDGIIEVLVDIEQRPNNENMIYIEKDNVNLDWNVTAEDRETIRTVSKTFREYWNNSPELSAVGIIEFEKDLDVVNYYDVYHPTGSLPFGRDHNESTLDINLRIWCTENIYVSSTAVFPTGGSANPGFTHLALTERLSKYLKCKIFFKKKCL